MMCLFVCAAAGLSSMLLFELCLCWLLSSVCVEPLPYQVCVEPCLISCLLCFCILDA